MCLFFDLKKAFDTVAHIVLMNKLKLLGIPTLLLHWLFSYLHGRFQRVVVGGKISSCVKVFFSVPQGSVLGPLLLIYINDITKLHCMPRLMSGSKLSLYADHIVLYKAVSNNSDIHDFQNDIDLGHEQLRTSISTIYIQQN